MRRLYLSSSQEIPMQGTCATCAHSFLLKDPGNEKEARVCRRYPPSVNIIPVRIAPSVTHPQGGMMPQVQSSPPAVSDDWGCGEYKSLLTS
jgi:hypothetical protein